MATAQQHLDSRSNLMKLCLAWVTLFVVGTDLFVVSPLLPLIADHYLVSAPVAGLAVTAFSVSYMLTAPVWGEAADRFGRRTILCCGLAGFSLANLLSAQPATFELFIAARALAGCMAAGVTPSLYALVGESAPPSSRGKWLAIAVSGLLLSLSAGTPLCSLAAAHFGWSEIFFGLGVIGVILLLPNFQSWPALPSAPKGVLAAQPGSGGYGIVRRLGVTVLWSTSLYSIYTYLGAGLEGAEFTAEQIAGLMCFYGIGAVAGNLAGGCLADRLGSRAVIAISLFGTGLAFIALRMALGFGGVFGIALCIASFTAQLFFPAQQAGLAAEFPSRRASVLAWNNSALFLGISLGSLVGGEAVGIGGFGTDLMVAAATAFLGYIAFSASAWAQRSAAAGASL